LILNLIMSKKGVNSKVKAEWSHEGKNYFIVGDKSEHNSKEGEIVFTPKELIDEIVGHNRILLLSIKNGRIKKDFLHLLHSTRRNLESGEMIGTKEAILRKFKKIGYHFENIKKIKYKILDNLYMAIVESSQALFLIKGVKVTSPRNIPEKLKEVKKKFKLKLDTDSAKEIITIFKDYEHSKISLPSGKKLDSLRFKAKKFQDEIKSLL